MATQEKIPKLDIHSARHRKIKQQKSTKRSQRSKYYSPSHHEFDNSAHNRYFSPRSNASGYDQLSSPRSSYYQPYGPACGTNLIYPKGFYENIGLPNHYLDYQPDMPFQFRQRPCNSEYMMHSNMDNYEYSPRYQWKVAEHDISVKEINKQKQTKQDVQTQTAQLQKRQKAINTQTNFNPLPKHQNPQNINEQQKREAIKIQSKKQNIQNNKNILEDLEEQSYERQRNSYTFEQNKAIQPSPIKNKIISQHVIEQQPIINSDFSHSSSFEGIKPNPEQYKKTFSEAILDEILQKDQKQYEQKYNSDNKYSQVIVGKLHKRVEIKQNISNYQQIKKETKTVINNFTENQQQDHFKKEEHNSKIEENKRQRDTIDNQQRGSEISQNRNNWVETNEDLNSYNYNTNINYRNHSQQHQHNDTNFRKMQLQSANTNNLNAREYNNHLGIENARNIAGSQQTRKMQPKHLNRQTTVSVVVNRGEDRNKYLRDSIAQTNDQSNQNSRNQVIQTDNSRNHLIFEKLVKNIVNDQEFRRRINQKTDEFNNIKIQFEDDNSIQLNDLINSKDAYVRYSKQFLQKLNNIIQDQRYMIRSDKRIERRQETKYLEVPQKIPHQIPIQRAQQAVPPQIMHRQQRPVDIQQQRKSPPHLMMNPYQNPQQNVIVSVPLGPPVLLPGQPNFYSPFPQQVMHPMPQQVIEQVSYQRSVPNLSRNITNRMN